MLPPLQPLLKRAEKFLLESQLWVFLSVLFFFGIPLHDFTEAHSGLVYFNIVAGLTVFFLPLLAFVARRKGLKSSLSPWGYRALWLGVFGAYPLVSYFLNITLNTLLVGEAVLEQFSSWNEDIFHIIGWVFAVVDLLLHGPLTKKWLPDLGRWFQRINGLAIAGLVNIGLSLVLIVDTPAITERIASASVVGGALLFGWYFLQATLFFAPFGGLFYFHQRVLFRKLYAKRGLLYYLAGMMGTVLVFTPIHAFFAQAIPMVTDFGAFSTSIVEEANYLLPMGVMVFSLPLILFLEWTHKTRTIAQLERQQTETELTLLKEQINPHFFFNTLNNLYALSLKQAPETPETVLQLSELMRYVIYRAKEEKVELHEEIDYLRDYLDLQRIRLQPEAEIDFVVNIDNPTLEIPPLLFIILVENAFKHGIEKATEECFLQLTITERDGEIKVVCRNSVEDNGRDRGLPPGIGIDNLTRRLALLYPEAHDLRVSRPPGEYRVELTFWQTVTLRELELNLEDRELVPSVIARR